MEVPEDMMDDFMMTPRALEKMKEYADHRAKKKGLVRVLTGSGLKDEATVYMRNYESEFELRFGGEYGIIEDWYENKFLKLTVKVRNIGEKRGWFSSSDLRAFDINGVELELGDYRTEDKMDIRHETQLLPGAECEEHVYISYDTPYIFVTLAIADAGDEGDRYVVVGLEEAA